MWKYKANYLFGELVDFSMLGRKYVLPFPRFCMYISAFCFCQLRALKERGTNEKYTKVLTLNHRIIFFSAEKFSNNQDSKNLNLQKLLAVDIF